MTYDPPPTPPPGAGEPPAGAGEPPAGSPPNAPPPNQPYQPPPNQPPPGQPPYAAPPAGQPPYAAPPAGQPAPPPYAPPPAPGYGPPPQGYPPAGPAYPPQAPGYQPQAPGYPPPAPGYAPPPPTAPPAGPPGAGGAGGNPAYGAPQPPAYQQAAPGAAWGSTSPGGTPAKSSFDASSVNPLDWGILAAGLLALIFSFFSYYTASATVGGFKLSVHENAWHGFFGWFAALVALLAAGLLAATIFSPGQLRLPLPLRLVVVGGFAVATLSVLLAWFVTPGVGGGAPGLDIGRGVGFYLSLIVIIAGLVLSVLRLRATGGKLPWENRSS